MSARGLLAIGLGALAISAAAAPLPVEGTFAGFDGATTWLNGTPLTPQKLRGKVVLVDFWTYSCINCIRTLPYVRAWAERYRDQGLVVVGVHTPEFRFEQDLTNVNAAIGRFGIGFPVAVDSDQRIWRAWGNRYWPAVYLVDAAGRVRYHQFGEGDYARTEQAIQSLLAEARGGAAGATGFVKPVMPGEQSAPDLASLASDETYVGYRKAENFRSAERVAEDRPRQYSVAGLAQNQWGLAGRWIVGAESAVADAPDARIAYQFSARDLHLVLGPGAPGPPGRSNGHQDGQPPGAAPPPASHPHGNGVVTATRLYQLVRQSGKVRARRFEVRFLERGAEAYAFTFG